MAISDKINNGIRSQFNDRGHRLNEYTIQITRPAENLQAQAEDFFGRLDRWLMLQGLDFKGRAKTPEVIAPSANGNAQIRIECTEAAMAAIERQFAADILRVDPQAQHIRGSIIPPKVDPWDVSKW